MLKTTKAKKVDDTKECSCMKVKSQWNRKNGKLDAEN